MLTAIKKDGTWITLPEKMPANVLAKWRKSENYYCPCCKTEMSIKAGNVRIPHFAHKSNSSCRASSEPESAYHLMGKRKLYQWFLSHDYQVDLEAYLPQIKKRADILVTIGGYRFAVEFQCSVIPENEFIERTRAYQSVGIKPIWILAAKSLKRKSMHEFRLSGFQWLFVTGSCHHPFLWMYCPETDRLSVLKNLTPFSPRVVFAELTTASLTILNPSRLTPKKSSCFPFLPFWRYKRKVWCLHRVKAARRSDPFLKGLYLHHITPPTIPIEIGVPVRGMLLIETPTIEWQAWIYMDVFQEKKPGEKISMDDIIRFFKKRTKNGEIKLRSLPLLHEKPMVYPVGQYIQLLEDMGCISKAEEEVFKVEKRLSLPSNSDEGQMMERIFYNEHKTTIEKGNIQYNQD
ncbi:Competence protein CoiA [Peribacillus sp. Bi96]|uniref:competence protein CoiA n=1 Tax=Peribacillus sp. Bi96 TaxID=2884273 RepID=UPI001D4FA56A|nr:competence protein CoiA family protein [Peribacillus sp. Bi96]CAH0318421.1 Competence protein CoiA [Peribacillus sp. Bi96]